MALTCTNVHINTMTAASAASDRIVKLIRRMSTYVRTYVERQQSASIDVSDSDSVAMHTNLVMSQLQAADMDLDDATAINKHVRTYVVYIYKGACPNSGPGKVPDFLFIIGISSLVITIIVIIIITIFIIMAPGPPKHVRAYVRTYFIHSELPPGSKPRVSCMLRASGSVGMASSGQLTRTTNLHR